MTRMFHAARLILIAACSALVFTSKVTFAHHGWSSYDNAKTVTLTGKVTEVKFSNPHAIIKLEPEAKGEAVREIILAPTSRMESRGLTQDQLKEGMTVTIVGYVNKTRKDEMRAERITVGDKTVELR